MKCSNALIKFCSQLAMDSRLIVVILKNYQI